MTHFCNKSLRGTDCCSPYDAIIAMINNAQSTADAALALAGNVSTNLGILMSTVATAIARLDALGSVMTYKGSVATYADLPATGNEIGDTYNVIATGQNYAWDGTTWDLLGSVVDLSPYLKSADAAATYLTIANAASTYETLTGAASKYVAQATDAGATNRLYGRTGASAQYPTGQETLYQVWDPPYAFSIPRRISNGVIRVGTPTDTDHATTKAYVDNGLSFKQATLVSGTNIKTVNGNDLLGSGNIVISAVAQLTEASIIALLQNRVYLDDLTIKYRDDNGGETTISQLTATTVSCEGVTITINNAYLSSPSGWGTYTDPAGWSLNNQMFLLMVALDITINSNNYKIAFTAINYEPA